MLLKGMIPMSQLKGACIIGQSGGPTSVINASAYGAIKTALESDCITKVLGARHGIKGRSGRRPHRHGQGRPTVERCVYRLQAHPRNLQKVRLSAISSTTAGNDSMDTCNKIPSICSKNGYDCRRDGHSQDHRQRPGRHRSLPGLRLRRQVHRPPL